MLVPLVLISPCSYTCCFTFHGLLLPFLQPISMPHFLLLQQLMFQLLSMLLALLLLLSLSLA